MSIASSLAPYIFEARSLDDSGARNSDVGRQYGDTDTSPSPSGSDTSERALILSLQAGNTTAMETVVVKYADQLIRFAITFVRDRSDAEDVVYDVFGNLWRQRTTIDPNRSLKTYLFSAVRNRSLNRVAHDQVRVRSASYLESETVANASVLTPEDLLFASAEDTRQRAQIIALREAISTLSDRHQQALHLRFEQELSYPAIGTILNISDKAAQQLVLRAIGTLRRILGV